MESAMGGFDSVEMVGIFGMNVVAAGLGVSAREVGAGDALEKGFESGDAGCYDAGCCFHAFRPRLAAEV